MVSAVSHRLFRIFDSSLYADRASASRILLMVTRLAGTSGGESSNYSDSLMTGLHGESLNPLIPQNDRSCLLHYF